MVAILRRSNCPEFFGVIIAEPEDASATSNVPVQDLTESNIQKWASHSIPAA
jgi:hypothetical protein